MEPADRVVVALDRPSIAENVALAAALSGRARWFKVGLRSYYDAAAHELLATVEESGARLFLDVKLHDIPSTVRGAARSLARHAPAWVTVHASGGAAMVEAAVEGLAEGGADDAVVLAVTVLTSLDEADIAAWASADGVERIVARLASSAVESGAGGVVCSPNEAEALAEVVPNALRVTPGIRPAGSALGDQKRAKTPRAALVAGATHLVIGRPIHAAADPVTAFDAIIDELAKTA